MNVVSAKASPGDVLAPNRRFEPSRRLLKNPPTAQKKAQLACHARFRAEIAGLGKQTVQGHQHFWWGLEEHTGEYVEKRSCQRTSAEPKILGADLVQTGLIPHAIEVGRANTRSVDAIFEMPDGCFRIELSNVLLIGNSFQGMKDCDFALLAAGLAI